MRIVCAVALFLSALPAAAARAEESYPYKATIIVDNAVLRSGPNEFTFDETGTLPRGTEVEVYRHDPNGFSAIRPPQGSFSWVQAGCVKRRADPSNLADVTTDRARVLVGGAKNSRNSVTQVNLHTGEVVEVLGEDTFAVMLDTNVAVPEKWYKISPPSGEFRWIADKAILGVNEKPAPTFVTASAAPASAPPAQAQRADWVAPHSAAPAGAVVPASATTSTAGTPAAPAAAATNGGSEVVAIPAASIPPPAPPAAPVAPSAAPQSEMDAISLQLSQMLSGDPRTWQFDTLTKRTNAALASAASASEKSRASGMLREIEQYEAVRRQYMQLGNTAQPAGVNTTVGGVASPAAVAAPVDVSRYDGVGRLTTVDSKRPGAPRFALTDDAGQLVTFVTPDADLPLQPYVGHVVGLSGIRGFMPQLNKPHLTAKRVTLLDSTAMR